MRAVFAIERLLCAVLVGVVYRFCRQMHNIDCVPISSDCLLLITIGGNEHRLGANFHGLVWAN